MCHLLRTADSSLNFPCSTRLSMVCAISPQTSFALVVITVTELTTPLQLIDLLLTQMLTITTYNFCMELTTQRTCNCSICFCFKVLLSLLLLTYAYTTSGNRAPGSRFHSDLLDTSVCIHQLLPKR